MEVVVAGEDLVAALAVEEDDDARVPRELIDLALAVDARAVERLVHVPDDRVELLDEPVERRQHLGVLRAGRGDDLRGVGVLVGRGVARAGGERLRRLDPLGRAQRRRDREHRGRVHARRTATRRPARRFAGGA